MPKFIKGLELSEIFYCEAVAPILAQEFPGLSYSAGLLDYGSDLLGFDTERSMDHGWAPRVNLFLRAEELAIERSRIEKVMAEKLPLEIRGFSTNVVMNDDGSCFMQAVDKGPVRHMVSVSSVEDYAKERLGLGLSGELSPADWLSVPQQRLAVLQSGGIFHDELGSLGELRKRLGWYPHELWLHLMACQWEQIAQEEPFVGRCGHSGDELGSQVVAARLVKQLMQLCFLMEKRFKPYSKWIGSAFATLACAPEILPQLKAALESSEWKAREGHMSLAYEAAARMHNALGLTRHQDTQVTAFYSRPYLVIKGGRFAEALRDRIDDPEIKRLPKGLGSIDQMTDNVDILENPERCKKIILGSI